MIVVLAEDIAGNIATASIALTCAIDLDHLSLLISIGESNNWITNHGIAQSLQSTVTNIQKAPTDQIRAKKFQDLLNEITRENGKQIVGPFAELLLADLQFIETNGF